MTLTKSHSCFLENYFKTKNLDTHVIGQVLYPYSLALEKIYKTKKGFTMADVSNPSLSAQEFKRAFCTQGIWHPDSFKFIVVKMFKCRPSLCLHERQPDMQTYAELIDLACEYADAAGYPWIKAKLKHVVETDLKGFYDTLAQCVGEGKKELFHLHERDVEHLKELATIWIKVGAFTDDPKSQN